MPEFSVRVGLGNGTIEQKIVVTAPNAEQAKKQAAAMTGGKALGQYQVSNKK